MGSDGKTTEKEKIKSRNRKTENGTSDELYERAWVPYALLKIDNAALLECKAN